MNWFRNSRLVKEVGLGEEGVGTLVVVEEEGGVAHLGAGLRQDQRRKKDGVNRTFWSSNLTHLTLQ